MEDSIAALDRERKLASVQRVAAVRPHPDPGVTRLEVATVLGWEVVVAKDEGVTKGQLVVYCEIDSLLPGDAEWLPPAIHARVEKQKDRKWFRVKSVRLRKQLSQGLIITQATLPGCAKEGDDVTELLGVTKFEEVVFSGKFAPGEDAATKSKGESIGCWKPFPSHLVQKTDEVRIQSQKWLLGEMQGKPYYSTVKLDGTSGTFLVDPVSGEFWVCSRNNIRIRPTKLHTCPYWTAAINAKLEDTLRTHAPYLAIQGEICGPNIAKNRLKLSKIEFFVFNVIDLRHPNGGRRLPLDEFRDTCDQLGLKTVPVESVGDVFEYDTVDKVLEAAKGKYESGKTREGLVFRTWDQSISFKAINNDFLV